MRRVQKCITIDPDVAAEVEIRANGNYSAEVEHLLRVGLQREKKADELIASRMAGVVTEVIRAVR